MAVGYLNGKSGLPGTTSGYSAYSLYCPAPLPVAKVAADGHRRGLIESVLAYCSGRGGNNTISLGFAGATTSSFGITTAGSAQSTDYRTLNKYVDDCNGAGSTFYINGGSPTKYFGRISGTSGVTTTDGVTTWSDTTLSGAFNWFETPDAPTIDSLTPQPGGVVDVVLTAPVSDGGKAVTGYKVQYSEDVGFTSPTTVDFAGLSDSITLEPGKTYWFRAGARNSVSDHWSTTGPWSTVETATMMSGGSIMISGNLKPLKGKIKIGGVLKDLKGQIKIGGVLKPLK